MASLDTINDVTAPLALIKCCFPEIVLLAYTAEQLMKVKLHMMPPKYEPKEWPDLRRIPTKPFGNATECRLVSNCRNNKELFQSQICGIVVLNEVLSLKLYKGGIMIRSQWRERNGNRDHSHQPQLSLKAEFSLI